VKREPLLWALAALLFAAFSARKLTQDMAQPNDFSGIYTAARMLRAGEDARGFYDDAKLLEAHGRYSPRGGVMVKPSPPSTSFLLLPLAFLSQDAAQRSLCALGLVLFAAASLTVVSRTPLQRVLAPGFLCLAVLSTPVRANFAQGQVYVLLFALSVLAWRSFEQGRDRSLGICLGLLAASKLALPALWILLLARKRWRALAWGATTVLSICAATLPVVGLPAWRLYVSQLPDFGFGRAWLIPVFQSQLSLLQRLFTFDPDLNPHPVADVRTFASAALVVSLAIALSVPLWWLRKNDRLAFGAAILVSLLASPFSEDYHYVFALLPIALLLGRRTVSPAFATALAAGIVLVLAPFNPSWTYRGWEAVVEYPMVAGAWMLLGLCVA
jgi:hypothetical protein